MKNLKLWQKAGLVAAIVTGLTLGGLTPNYSSKGLESKLPSIGMSTAEVKEVNPQGYEIPGLTGLTPKIITTKDFKKLYKIHKPHVFEFPEEFDPDEDVEKQTVQVSYGKDSKKVTIEVPAFKKFNCGSCHTIKELAENSKNRLEKGIETIISLYPDIFKIGSLIPDRYIIIPYTTYKSVLREAALACAEKPTQDIYIFPSSILFEKHYLNDTITAHEQIHLGQEYFWLYCETETGFLNSINSNGKSWGNTLLPFYKDIIANFIDNSLDEALNNFYQKYNGNDVGGMICLSEMPSELEKKIKKALEKLKPVFIEAAKERLKNSLEWDYQYRDLAVETLIIDIISTKMFPNLKNTDQEKIEQGLIILKEMKYSKSTLQLPNFAAVVGFGGDFKTTATRELTQAGFSKDESRAVYFAYLKKRFINDDGSINFGSMPNKDYLIDEKLYFMELDKKILNLTKEEEKVIDTAIKKLELKLSPGYKRQYCPSSI